VLLYKKSISYGRFIPTFLGLSIVSNFFVGIICIAFKEVYMMMILSIFQYLPVFIYSCKLSKPNVISTDNTDDNPYYNTDDNPYY